MQNFIVIPSIQLGGKQHKISIEFEYYDEKSFLKWAQGPRKPMRSNYLSMARFQWPFSSRYG